MGVLSLAVEPLLLSDASVERVVVGGMVGVVGLVGLVGLVELEGEISGGMVGEVTRSTYLGSGASLMHRGSVAAVLNLVHSMCSGQLML